MISRDDNDGRYTPKNKYEDTHKKYPKMLDFKVKGDSFLNIAISGIYVKFQGCNSQVSRDTCILIEGRVFIRGDLESCCTGQRTKAPQAAQAWFISAEGAYFRTYILVVGR